MIKKRSDTDKKHNGSLIISYILSFFELIKNIARDSFILSHFVNYDKINKKYADSVFSEKISLLSRFKIYLLKFKVACAKKAQTSIIINFFKNIISRFFNTSLTTTAIFLLSYGAFLIFHSVAKNPDKILALEYTDSFILGVTLCVLSLILIPFRKKTIISATTDSRVCSYISFKIFSFDISKSYPGKPYHSIGFAFVSGIVCGIVSAVYSPLLIVYAVFFILVLSVIFVKPENGLLLICLTLPFCNDKILAFFIFVTALSSLFKTIRGKRAFHFNLTAACLSLLLLIAISSCLFSYDDANAVSDITPVILSVILGFLVISLVNSSKLALKCCNTLTVSAILSAVFALGKIIFANIFVNELHDILNIVLNTRVSSSFKSSEFFAAFIIALVPIVLIKNKTRSVGIIAILSAILLCTCLILTNSYFAVTSMILAFIIYVLIFKKYGLFTVLLLGLSLPAVKYFSSNLSQIVVQNYLPGFSIPDNVFVNDTTYNLSEFISQFWLFGSGSGSDSVAFASAQTGLYSSISDISGSFLTLTLKIGIPLTITCVLLISIFVVRIIFYALRKNSYFQAKSICSSIFCSSTALLIYAVFSNYFISLKILSLFFLIICLGVAAANSAENDYISPFEVRDMMF